MKNIQIQDKTKHTKKKLQQNHIKQKIQNKTKLNDWGGRIWKTYNSQNKTKNQNTQAHKQTNTNKHKQTQKTKI